MAEMNESIIKALNNWVMYAQQILHGGSLSKDMIKKRNENRKWLERNGIKDIFISNITQEAYDIRFSYKGNTVEKVIAIREETFE